MYRKILDTLTILSTILALGIIGTGFFTYRTVKSEKFQKEMMDKVLGNVKNTIPKVIDNALPRMTGPSLPMPQQPKR